MTAVVLARPVAIQPPPDRPFEQPEYTMLWTGADGVTWDLYSWRTGVYLSPGLHGLDHPPTERWTKDSPAVPGTLFGGARALTKPVQWPIVISTMTTEGTWRDLARRWWRGWSTITPGTWTVQDATGASKRLRLRHNPAGSLSLDIDPGVIPWVPWTVEAIADQPYWEGDPIEVTFHPPESRLFFGGGDPDDPGAVEAGPPFHVSASLSLGAASIPNPGDVPAPWQARIAGPFEAWSITLNGGTVSGPAVAAGHWWDVSADPTWPIAVADDTDEVTRELGAWDPRPVPAGGRAPIDIQATGSGSITVRITPRYEHGF